MTPEQFDAEMCASFPRLYADRDKPASETCMCWGFDSIGRGWYGLIRELSSKLEPLIVAWIEANGEADHPRAAQVKEKWGGLRFYMTSATEEMWPLIEEAEKTSYTTCMHCAARDGVTTAPAPRWILSLCPECRKPADDAEIPRTTSQPTT